MMKKNRRGLAAYVEKLRKQIEEEPNEESLLSKMELDVEEEKHNGQPLKAVTELIG